VKSKSLENLDNDHTDEVTIAQAESSQDNLNCNNIRVKICLQGDLIQSEAEDLQKNLAHSTSKNDESIKQEFVSFEAEWDALNRKSRIKINEKLRASLPEINKIIPNRKNNLPKNTELSKSVAIFDCGSRLCRNLNRSLLGSFRKRTSSSCDKRYENLPPL